MYDFSRDSPACAGIGTSFNRAYLEAKAMRTSRDSAWHQRVVEPNTAVTQT